MAVALPRARTEEWQNEERREIRRFIGVYCCDENVRNCDAYDVTSKTHIAF